VRCKADKFYTNSVKLGTNHEQDKQSKQDKVSSEKTMPANLTIFVSSSPQTPRKSRIVRIHNIYSLR
jgi:hypothetical protein